MSLITEGREKHVRMSHLAVVGSHAVNGVSQLHSGLLRTRMFPDFDEFFPRRFCATTNGITPRRWLLIANPALSELVTDLIGDRWLQDICLLEDLLKFSMRPEVTAQWAAVKQLNKERLAALIHAELEMTVDINSLFDCQVKRIHEYKRQLLNILHIVVQYNRIRYGVQQNGVPRTVIFAGKAAPGYELAKSIIRLIHAVADVINNDPRVEDRLKVVFLANYNVSLAELIIPATDLSEQISTAGTEASGTGNMKSMLNGALTIGTLDGANIEILEAVGQENIFIFGKTAEQVEEAVAGDYDPWDVYHHEPELRQAIDMIRDGFFSSGDETVFGPLIDELFRGRDRYLVLAEFSDYVTCQEKVAQAYLDQDLWMRKSIINVARSSRFSSDQTVRNYARNIWGLDVDG